MATEAAEAAAVALCVLVLSTLLFTSAERMWGARARGCRDTITVLSDALYFVVNPVLGHVGAAFMLSSTHIVLHTQAPEWVAWSASVPWWAQLCSVVVVGDFLHYVAHRAMHHWSFLWRFHAIHHSSQQVDWLSTHRGHPVDAVVLTFLSNLPAILVGFKVETVLTFILLQRLHTVFVHANLNLGRGAAGRTIALPRFHHWHHACGPAPSKGAVNFATFLPVFDVIFGTFLRGSAAQPHRYGISEEEEDVGSTMLHHLIHAFRRPGPEVHLR